MKPKLDNTTEPQHDAKLPVVRCYRVWEAAFYESISQMFPRDDQYYGEFKAENESDLKKQLTDKGYNPEKCRWEFDGQFD